MENRVTLRVTGISSEECASRIRDGLRELSGVDTVEVDCRRGIVEIGGSELERADLADILCDIGYTAVPE